MVNQDERLVKVIPHERQVKMQQTGFYAFVHFTVNTYTGREWGDGTESPGIFDPEKLDADKWVEAVKSAGMKGLILTCKHHDGFCLWPSKYTEHSVKNSPWKNGKGDVVRETAEACKRGGIRFGVYLSPWDRHDERYGRGEEYDIYYVNQLTELLTDYGDIFCVWLDGACGEGPNGKKQIYDWARYFETVRCLQPDACINVCGPDIRWCGNEAGDTRESEWSVVPARTRDTERIKEQSQQSDDESFRQRRILASDRDLGSRKILDNEHDLVWYPAETNTSIRPGWFYHAEEDGKVKSVEELFEVYIKSVGGNSTFLLNIPPCPDGLFHPTDVTRLKELGEKIRGSFSDDLLKDAKITSDSAQDGHETENALTNGYEKYFMGTKPDCEINIAFPEEKTVSYVVMKENINLSQRIEKFSVCADGKEVYGGTVVGYKKIAKLPEPVTAKTLTVKIEDSRVCPTLSFIGVY